MYAKVQRMHFSNIIFSLELLPQQINQTAQEVKNYVITKCC